MDPRKPKRIRPAQKQKISMRMIVAAGISAVALTVVLVIYFQFFRNEVTRAKTTEILTQETLPVDFNIETRIIQNNDTLTRNGNRYKVAKPLSQTPAAPVK